MDATTKDLEAWIENMMTEKGINNYKMKVSGSTSKGDGYLGEVNFVEVTCNLEDGDEKIYNLVIKSAKTNKELRNNTPIAETYEREIRMYSEVLPIIKNFQKERAIENCFVSYAKCYNVCNLPNKEALILSNLKSLGYVLHDRMVPQNLEHNLHVFRTYALWHGSTLALKIKEPELFKKVTKDMTDIMGNFMKLANMLPLFEKHLTTTLDLLKRKGNQTLVDKIEKEKLNVETILTKMTVNDDLDAEREAVILHGDCWNNNMMFKYKSNNTTEPSEMVFIDFQISRVASPILDLSYYFYATADKEALNKLDYLLEEYHTTLSKYLKQYDLNCDEILTLKRLKKSWKKYGKFGLVMSPFILKTELTAEDEVIDFVQKAAENTLHETSVDHIKHQDEFERRVFNVFSHFADRFLS